MQDIAEILETYFRAWNEGARTAELIAQACAPDIHYVDPRYTCRGVAELAARITKGRNELPSSFVDFASAVDGYADTFRYTWVFAAPELELAVPGWDVITRRSDGRIATITSFFGVLESIELARTTRLQKPWSV